jgi:HAMP domain-containing protein
MQAFLSRSTCVELLSEMPQAQAMSEDEESFAISLTQMLHGFVKSTPSVRIERLEASVPPCGNTPTLAPAGSAQDARAPNPPEKRRHHAHTIGVTAVMPLDGQRWLSVASAVEVPGMENRLIALLFLASSLIVGVTAVAAVRTQTKSLRLLGEASERFGRGEAVAPLREKGPSEVIAATKAFNTMQQRLGEFIGDRMKLLAGISHDLRTPLTTLRLKAEFVKDKATRQGIIATIEELIVICEATLAFTRADATSEATAQVDLGTLVKNVCDELNVGSGTARATELQHAMYSCRPVALKRALRNLVENALRYGGNARVSPLCAASSRPMAALCSLSICLPVDSERKFACHSKKHRPEPGANDNQLHLVAFADWCTKTPHTYTLLRIMEVLKLNEIVPVQRRQADPAGRLLGDHRTHPFIRNDRR